MKRGVWFLGLAVISCEHGKGEDLPAFSGPPPLKLIRYDESYEYLRDSSKRRDYFDSIKFIPLNRNGDRYLTFGGDLRERYEYYQNHLWGRGPQDSDGYLMQRYMAHADVHFGDSLRFFLQLASVLENGRKGGPRPTDRDDFDFHQAFVDLEVPLVNKDSLTLRVGRQELAYGSSRLISIRDGPNARRSYDGAKAIFEANEWRVDAFAVKPVRTKAGALDNDPDPDQNFWGVYAVTPVSWIPNGNVDLYYLGLDRKNATFDQGTAHEIRHTLGTRLWGNKAGWDYNLEFIYQFGSFGEGDIEAWSASSNVGFTFESAPLKPRIGLKANITSGDDNPNDADLQTINPLFPNGAYFGEPALIGPANHIDLHPQLHLTLLPNLTLTLDWDWFWRESTRDGLYGPAVNVIQSGEGSDARYVGNQAEVLLQWRVDRHLTFVVDYAHLFAGDFLKETTPGRDVDYFSVWAVYSF